MERGTVSRQCFSFNVYRIMYAHVLPHCRLEEAVKANLFLQKFDEFGNSQAFKSPMELEFLGVTLQGEPLEMSTKAQSSITQNRHQLLVKV